MHNSASLSWRLSLWAHVRQDQLKRNCVSYTCAYMNEWWCIQDLLFLWTCERESLSLTR